MFIWQKIKNFQISTFNLSLVVSIVLCAFYNVTFWNKVSNVFPMDFGNFLFYISLAVTIVGLQTIVFSIIGQLRILKYFLIVIFVLSSFAAYFMDSYHVIISDRMFQNIVETNKNEFLSLLNAKLLLYFVFFGVLPAFIISQIKIIPSPLKKNGLQLIATFLIIILTALGFGRSYANLFRNHKQVRYYTNPITYVYSLIKFTKKNLFTSTPPFTHMGLDAHAATIPERKKRLMILVVGETARSENFQLGGYKKETNPLLSQREDLVYFSNATSCGTETSISVPCMFSLFERTNYNDVKGRYYDNVLDVLKRANVNVLWRDNDDGCKGVCDRIENEDLNRLDHNEFCSEHECRDEILITNLEERINSVDSDQLIVLHQRGNHGPAYYKRTTEKFKKFKPECTQDDISLCEQETIVNAYDNAIVYTDYVLDHIITILQKYQDQRDVAMMYLSDHGESLGEMGVYLHAMPYLFAPREQIHIPWIIWTNHKQVIQKLSGKKEQEISHDHLSHTLLNFFQVNTEVYKKNLSLFAD